MILINAVGIQDSGGITVLEKILDECMHDKKNNYFVVCNENKNLIAIIEKYKSNKNFKFQMMKNKGFIYRLYYENIFFKKIIKKNKINLVYNFSGSAQYFSNIPQITKVHNLLFYAKTIDSLYSKKKEYIKWFTQIFLKRLVFHSMIKQTKYIEIQSSHVKEHISNFINISNKKFFIKSDITFYKENFNKIKNYDFSKKLNFLYIVGPHFEYLHKNFNDFVNTMLELQKINMNFKINITLTQEQLHNSKMWDKSLDKDTSFLGYISKNEIHAQFTNNTILISTSVIETLGLHVIEAVQNGVLSIVPNESYSRTVYGKDILMYELFNSTYMMNIIKKISVLNNNEIREIILKNQHYLINNENTKYKNITDIFNFIIKENNV